MTWRRHEFHFKANNFWHDFEIGFTHFIQVVDTFSFIFPFWNGCSQLYFRFKVTHNNDLLFLYSGSADIGYLARPLKIQSHLFQFDSSNESKWTWKPHKRCLRNYLIMVSCWNTANFERVKGIWQHCICSNGWTDALACFVTLYNKKQKKSKKNLHFL